MDAKFADTGNLWKTRLAVIRRANLLHKNYGAQVYLFVKVGKKHWSSTSRLN